MAGTLVVGPLAAPGGAAPGDPDPTFGERGVARATLTTDFGRGGYSSGGDRDPVLALPDGGVVATTSVNETVLAVRFLADGRLDPAFGDAGRATIEGMVAATAIAVDPSGRLVVVGQPVDRGSPTGPPSESAVTIARLLPTGVPDPSFGSGGIVTDVVASAGEGGYASLQDAAVAPDGAVVVGVRVFSGEPFARPDSGPRDNALVITRYLDGRRDPGFGDGGSVRQVLDQDTFDSDLAVVGSGPVGSGVVVVSGGVNARRQPTLLVSRLDATGRETVRRSTEGTEIGGYANGVLAMPDGGFMVLGTSGRAAQLLARFGPDATPDATFGNGGLAEVFVRSGNYTNLTGSAVQADGGVVLLHEVSDQPVGGGAVVTRVTPDGRIDRGFGTDGRVRIGSRRGPSAGGSLAVQPDGAVLLSGIDFQGAPGGGPQLVLTVTRLQGGRAPAGPEQTVRLAGADRVATAVVLSQATFVDAPPGVSIRRDGISVSVSGPGPDGGPEEGAAARDDRTIASSVVLARSDDYADALVGGPLAAGSDGPLLLTPGDRLDPRVLAEIRRVLVEDGEVLVLGGERAISAGITAQIETAGFAVRRYAGADRYATAVEVARRGLRNGFGTLFLATGTDFPDALSAGAAAAKTSGAVLLTQGATMPASVVAFLAERQEEGFGPRFAVGGLAAAADPGALAIAGADRYGTSAAVATRFFKTPETVSVASGRSFADALSGGARAARTGGPLLLSDPDALPAPIASYLTTNRRFVSSAFVLGGSAAVSERVLAAVQAAVQDAAAAP